MIFVIATLVVILLPAYLAYRIRPSKGVSKNLKAIRFQRNTLLWISVSSAALYLLIVCISLILGGPSPAGGRDGAPLSFWVSWQRWRGLLVPSWFCSPFPWLLLVSLWASLRLGHDDPAAGKRRRGASLESRRRFNPVTIWHWIPAWIMWLSVLAFIVVRLCVVESVDPKMTGMTAAMSFMMMACLLLVVVLAPFMIRQALENEPEPLTETSSPELPETYEKHRTANARGIYRILMVIIAGFCVSIVFMNVEVDPAVDDWVHVLLGVAAVGYIFLEARGFVKRRLRLKELLGD